MLSVFPSWVVGCFRTKITKMELAHNILLVLKGWHLCWGHQSLGTVGCLSLTLEAEDVTADELANVYGRTQKPSSKKLDPNACGDVGPVLGKALQLSIRLAEGSGRKVELCSIEVETSPVAVNSEIRLCACMDKGSDQSPAILVTGWLHGKDVLRFRAVFRPSVEWDLLEHTGQYFFSQGEPLLGFLKTSISLIQDSCDSLPWPSSTAVGSGLAAPVLGLKPDSWSSWPKWSDAVVRGGVNSVEHHVFQGSSSSRVGHVGPISEVGSRRHAEELELQKWFDAWIEILSTFISQAPAFANLGFLAKSSFDRVLRQKLECVS